MLFDLIISACGKSTRFSLDKPKWLLTHPKGNFMLIEAIKGLGFSNVRNVHLIILKQHVIEFDFVDIDGVLVKNSSNYLEPRWCESDGIHENIKALNDIYDIGKIQIILTTSRKSKYRDITINQLKKQGIKYDKLLMDLNHCQRIIINDFAKTNKYKNCDSLNIMRNKNNLSDYL